LVAAVAAVLATACLGSPPPEAPGQELAVRRVPPVLPSGTNWGVHVLALEVDGSGGLWAGTAGDGIWYLPADSARWRHIEAATDDDASISWGYVNSLAFTDDGNVWYGTVGNGFGMSADTGRTWRNWTIDELGPEWQYVALNGIRSRGDTVVIATADGVRITGDRGASWRCVQSAASVAGGPRANDGCGGRVAELPSEYVLSLDISPEGHIWVGHLEGVSLSKDGGRTWQNLGEAEGVPPQRIRAIAATQDTMVWVATESGILVDSLSELKFVPATILLPGWSGLPGKPRAIVPAPGVAEPSIVLSRGLAAGNGRGNFRIYFLAAGDDYKPAADMWTMTWTGPPLWPIGGSQYGLARVLAGEGPTVDYSNVQIGPDPGDAQHIRFERPIADSTGTNPFIDPTYRYGSTMGGHLQQHMGIEFNNPAGTPVLAIGNGVVAFAGEAEAGSNTVAILHDHRQDGQYVYSVYYHNRSLAVRHGQRVVAGDVIAQVGNTGRATNDHLHLEIHVAPLPDSSAIVNPDERFPPYAVNPELWVEPLPGMGTVAGRVLDANGQPVAGARVFGLVLPYPAETPFSFVETYGDRTRADAALGENFAIGDVPAGTYLLGTDIGDRRVWRRIRVEPGRVTFVEFRP
jgi:hypothetical protein